MATKVKRPSKQNGKKTISMKTVFILFVSVLALLTLMVLVKHSRLKYNWMKYAGESQKTLMEKDAKNAEDEAKIIANALAAQVSGRPLYKSTDLQSYVTNVSRESNRDLVVLDTQRKILADTIKANVGKKFTEDSEDQIDKTLMDGMTRSFVEKSTDYPNGLNQIVVPLKDAGGKIVGAVILSSDTLK